MDLITPDVGLIFWQTVTLLVVLVILSKFAWKPILCTLKKREQDIEAALKKAAEAQKIVAQLQADQQQLTAKAALERDKLIANAIATKETIIQEAKKEASQVSKQLITQAHKTIAQERKRAFDVLKSQVAMLAIQIAEKILERELQHKHTQEALLKNLTKELPLP